MKKILIFITLLSIPIAVSAKLQVATTTTDLAALVKEIGENEVEVFSIAKGTQDPHQIDAKPSYMVKLRTVDLLIAHGLELESAWLQPLIKGSRNIKLADKKAVFEVVEHLEPLEIPKGNISRAEGDVHPGGNPHFQFDPVRLGQAAMLIADRMGEINPSQKVLYLKNAEKFKKHLLEKLIEWQNRLKKTDIKEVVTYHKYFSYFCDRFKVQCEIQLEPKPGIPPTTSHLLSVIEQMKKRKIHLVLIENLYDDSVRSKLEQGVAETKVVRVPISVEGDVGISTNEQLIENLVKIFEKGSH